MKMRWFMPLFFLWLSGGPLMAAEKRPLLGGDLMDLLDKGGLVMIIILAGSVVGLALALERLLSLRVARLCPREMMESLKQALEKGDLRAFRKEVSGSGLPLARILNEGLKQQEHGPADVERAMEAMGGHEVERLKRPVRPLAILATVQPLLGLLGTIIGMIATFNMLGHTSPADRVAKLAPGIGQALYTTAAGLTVSIPFVLLYHYLIGRANRVAEAWSLMGSELVLSLKRASPGGEQP